MGTSSQITNERRGGSSSSGVRSTPYTLKSGHSRHDVCRAIPEPPPQIYRCPRFPSQQYQAGSFFRGNIYHVRIPYAMGGLARAFPRIRAKFSKGQWDNQRFPHMRRGWIYSCLEKRPKRPRKED